MEVVLQLQRETGLFEMAIESEKTDFSLCILTGKVTIPAPAEQVGMMSAHAHSQGGVTLEHEDVYAELQDHDLIYDDALKTLHSISLSETGAYWEG